MAPPCCNDAELFQNGVEHLKRASAIDHEIFRDDLATFSEVAIVRDAQVDADSKVRLTLERIGGHWRCESPGSKPRALQEFPVRLLVLAAVSGATAFAGIFSFATGVTSLAAASQNPPVNPAAFYRCSSPKRAPTRKRRMRWGLLGPTQWLTPPVRRN